VKLGQRCQLLHSRQRTPLPKKGMRRFFYVKVAVCLTRITDNRVTLAKVVGKICVLRKEVRLSCFSASIALLVLLSAGYSPSVTANSVTGFGNPSELSAPTSAQDSVDLRLQFYGGCAWDVFGRAGFLDSPVCQPAHSCHPFAWHRMCAAPLIKELTNAQKTWHAEKNAPSFTPKSSSIEANLCPWR